MLRHQGFADAPRRLVARDDRRQEIAPRRVRAFADCEPHGRERRARVRHVAQVAVVGGGCVALNCVDARGLSDRQPRAVEPKRGFRAPALFLGELADDGRGLDARARRGARERARDGYLRVLDGDARQVAETRGGEKARKLERHGRRRWRRAVRWLGEGESWRDRGCRRGGQRSAEELAAGSVLDDRACSGRQRRPLLSEACGLASF